MGDAEERRAWLASRIAEREAEKLRQQEQALGRMTLLLRLGRAWDQIPVLSLGQLLRRASVNGRLKTNLDTRLELLADEEIVSLVEAYVAERVPR